jgi:bifunctional DNA-binding transcriptional regulator/antitoxin component of YhaV-PrlF toxin-antitoxin module
MADGPGNGKIDREYIDSGVSEGDFVARSVQVLGRVDIPDDYLREVGLSVGDDIVVVLQGDGIQIKNKDEHLEEARR